MAFICREKSEKALKREAKKAEKKAKKSEIKEKKGGDQDQSKKDDDSAGGDETEAQKGAYGVATMNQSREKPKDKNFLNISVLSPKLHEQSVWIRARLHTSRATGKQCFFVLRQQQHTVQCLAFVNDGVSKNMIKFISR